MAVRKNIELLLQMVISVNQLSIYGAGGGRAGGERGRLVREMCRNPKHQGQLEKVEILTKTPLAELQANEERQGKLLQEH